MESSLLLIPLLTIAETLYDINEKRTDLIILRPSNLEKVVLLLGSILFVIGGFFILEKNSVLGWSSILFFGLCALVFIIQLFPNSSYLKLTDKGFEVRNLFRSEFTKWGDIKVFKIGYLPYYYASIRITIRKKVVTYDYEEGHTKYKIGKIISKSFTNGEGIILDRYGMSVKELNELMNEWKSKNK